MPKKKKTAITGYSIFLRDTRDEYQRKGWHFPRNNQDAFNFVGPLWKKLSDEARQSYNDKAKEEKRHMSNELENKFNALGVSFAELGNIKREEEESNDIMINTIINSIKDADFATTFKTQKFYLCHVNYFYANSSEIYKPAEIALSEFNLKKGVIARFHAFINPGPIETGYRFEAKRRLEETHLIPIEDPSWTCAEKDYVKLFNQIKNFLCKDNPNGRIPPIYTMQDDEKNNYSLSAVQSTFETLCEACNEEVSVMRIYPLPQLYHEMRRKALNESSDQAHVEVAQLITVSMALHDLERDKFCYSKGIACEYHEEKDIGNFCSLSVVTRLVYTMCDYLLNYLGEPLIPGGHTPKNSIIVKKEVNQKDTDKDGFQLIQLRRPKITPQARDSDWPQPSSSSSRASSHQQEASSGISYASAMRGNSSAPPLSQYDPLPSQLRFHTPRNAKSQDDNDDDNDDDGPPSSVYEGPESSLPTPNLSQNTVMSGYTASASLSQSSFASDLSTPTEAMRYLGRGRGGIRLQAADGSAPMNWASVAGRGARMKPSYQPN